MHAVYVKVGLLCVRLSALLLRNTQRVL